MEWSDKEDAILRRATRAIYFNDSSDYSGALYGIIGIITGRRVDEDDVIELYNQLEDEDEESM